MSIRTPLLRHVAYKAAGVIYYCALAAVVGTALLSLNGCSVNVVVAPYATLAVKSDLSQNAAQEVVNDYPNR
jgi:hypothetical protein